MTPTQAVLLGVVQGLTEFLPVSSSGHLVIFQKAFGLSHPPINFDILVHTATLIAVIIVFRKEIIQIKKSLIKAIIVGSIPTAIIGLLLESQAEQLFNSLTIVGLALLVTTVLLLSTRFIKTSNQNPRSSVQTKSAFFIGIAQGIAVIPGISRSGSTIIAGLWSGLDQKTAVTFAFLISIPAIVGAQLLQLSKMSALQPGEGATFILGFVSAAITGIISLKILKLLVEKNKLYAFSAYTGILAVLVLLS